MPKKHPAPLDHSLVETAVAVAPDKGKLPGLDTPATRTSYHCSVCNRTWREPPTSRCPGAPIYSWQPWTGSRANDCIVEELRRFEPGSSADNSK